MIFLVRDNQLHELKPEVFWPWARGGHLKPTDLLLDSSGDWHSAAAYPELKPWIAEHLEPKPDVIGAIFKTAFVAGGVLALFKIGQAIVDEDFGGRSFPASFRRQKITAHIASHGTVCFGCNTCVREDELTIDHVVAWAKGGLTSRQNAAVICGSCNSRKGAKVDFLDHLRGRSA